jgi:hypothetical protein
MQPQAEKGAAQKHDCRAFAKGSLFSKYYLHLLLISF